MKRLVPGDIRGLGPLRMRYTLLLNEVGGILDDLMATRLGDRLFVVVNAATKDRDFAHLQAHLGPDVWIDRLDDRALLALQGPAAACGPRTPRRRYRAMPLHAAAAMTLAGQNCLVTRSGYTGEDGFEISLPAAGAQALAERLLAEPEVKPVGLGARDSLRLEAGLCLYGYDIDETTTPIEADLAWTIGKRRRADGDFPGATIILRAADGWTGAQARRHPSRRARAGARRNIDPRSRGRRDRPCDERRIWPIARDAGGDGLCRYRPAAEGTVLSLAVRGTPRPAHVVPLPFVPHRYHALNPTRCRGFGRSICPGPQRNTPMTAPRFTKDHEWVRLDGDLAVIGITDYAQSQLGDVVYVELPEIGRHIEQGKEAAVVESVKAASDVYAPVSGEVAEVNDTLAADPAKVNSDPMGEGWFLKLRLADPKQLDQLMDEAAYQRFVEEQH